jgi:hypothetical protein
MLIKVKDIVGLEIHFADPDEAVCSWSKETSWWNHKLILHKTHSGRYWQQSPSDSFYTKFLSHRDAAVWLLESGYQVPKDLEYLLKNIVVI